MILSAILHPPRRLVTTSVSLLLLLAPALAQAQRPNAYNSTMHWVGTWGASPTSPTTSAFTNQTVRLVIHTSIGGSAVRIRLSNALSSQALSIGAAHIAVRDSGANIIAGSDRVLTFGGATAVSIPNGADTLSDPVVLPVPVMGDLAISLYLPGNQTPGTGHIQANQTSYISPANGGDHTGDVTFATDTATPTTTSWPILSGVEVYVPTATEAVVTFGDSITDGMNSTLDANHRWPDILSQRLQAAGLAVGVLNQGIAGNRVLNDGTIFGPAGESRFERDVLVSGNVKFDIELLGINDIGDGTSLFPTQNVTADQIIAGKKQFIARAHAQGIKVFGCTILPCGKASIPNYANAGNEAKRQAVNAFIRAAGNYDGIIDFDAVMQDPANPVNLNPSYDSGDGLHPNDAGYQVMGNAVPLSLFQ